MRSRRLTQKQLDLFYIKKRCVVCQKPFYVTKRKNHSSGLPAYIRGINSITCSQKCSKIKWATKIS